MENEEIAGTIDRIVKSAQKFYEYIRAVGSVRADREKEDLTNLSESLLRRMEEGERINR